MIISKDLFIFGEQIFATIIPEIGTPNSGNSATVTTTPPATPPVTPTPTPIPIPTRISTSTIPTLPVVATNAREEYFQHQNEHQQQKQIQPIKSNTIVEDALKVAAKNVVGVTATTTATIEAVTAAAATTTNAKVGAAEQVRAESTGTISIITKANKITTTTTAASASASSQVPAAKIITKNLKSQQKVEKTLNTNTKSCKPTETTTAKKAKFQKLPKEIKKLDKGKRELQLQVELQKQKFNDEQKLEQFERQNKLLLLKSNNQERQNQKQKQKEKQNLEYNQQIEEEQYVDVEKAEKRPLVQKDPIKIINAAAVTLPAHNTTQRGQGKTDDETLFLLLDNEPEIKQYHQEKQQHQDLNQLQTRQQTECRLQLEEFKESEEKLLSAATTATQATIVTTERETETTNSTSTISLDKACLSSSRVMGKVILGNNGSGGNNTTTTRNDHAMVTFPFITDHHRTLQLTFQNITVLHNDRKILSDISGVVSPGEVLAIMGPSGCGKTTLLDCLSGQRRIDAGSVYLNREALSKKWRRKICYVLQEEVFFSGLTLRETVMYTALLRLPEKMPKAEKIKLVDRILQTLELNCCQQTKFGDYMNRGLSGGEKKRANIACELLTNPLLMLLDEPTSGLDSHSAISLMKVLKRYAMQEQKTVVITVHQPSSQMFHMFDKLLLLYNGRTAYFGEVNNIYSYFEDIGVAIKPHYNPADFVLELLKSYPDIREKLFVAAKESHGNFINRNCITFNTKNHNQQKQKHHQTQNTHHNQPTNGHITTAHHLSITTSNGNSDKSQQRDALINNIINNYYTYKDISSNPHVNHNNHNNHHHLHSNQHHINHDPPLLIMDGGADTGHHHDSCEDAAQQLWCATADSQSNFSSTSSDYHQYETEGDWLDYPTHFYTQFRVLLSRNFKEAKPLMLSKLNWFQTIGLALMAGAIWFQLPRTEDFLHDLQGWMFFSQTYWMLFALFGALNSFPAEREVISKERRSGAYRLSAYYLAKMFGELPLVVTLPTVYLIISYPMLGCASFKLFFLMLVFLLLNTIVAQSVGFFIGACCMDMNVSITLSALYTLATQLFGGYLSSRIPEGLSWIRYTSMIHYAYQNMQILEFREGPSISCGNPSSFEICKNNLTSVIPYEEILKAQNSTSPLWLNTLVLMMFFLVFRVLGYAVLRYIRCPKT